MTKRDFRGLHGRFVVLVGCSVAGWWSMSALGGEIRPGDVVVTVRPAPLMAKDQTLLTVEQGLDLVAIEVRGSWVAVSVDRFDKEVRGWIDSANLGRVARIASAEKREWRLDIVSESQSSLRPLVTFSLKDAKGVGGASKTEIQCGDLIAKWQQSQHQLGGAAASTMNLPLNIPGDMLGAGFYSASAYYLRVNGEQVLASELLPDARGETSSGKAGRITFEGQLMPGQSAGEAVPNFDGEVWTSRVERIGDIDLAEEGPISDTPGFDFRKFRGSAAVMPFASGYGVNLHGALIKNGHIVRQRFSLDDCKGCYETKDGKSLPGRILRCRWVQEDDAWTGLIEEIVLKAGQKQEETLLTQPIPASEPQGVVVGMTKQQVTRIAGAPVEAFLLVGATDGAVEEIWQYETFSLWFDEGGTVKRMGK